MGSIARPVLVLAIFATTASSLLTIPSSPCTSVCGDINTTNGSDIVCYDSDYTSSAVGIQFQECITCQLNSTAVDATTGISDLQWLLYNLRYSMSWCLWGYPNNTKALDTPCLTDPACGFLKNNIIYEDLATNVTEYGYCADINNDAIGTCNTCLENIGDEFYLNNFFTAVVAGCEQQPAAGAKLSLTGTLFSSTPVNITSPSAVPTYNTTHNGLTQLDQIGIAVGAIVVALIAAGFFIVCRGKRRRRRELQEMQQNERNGGDYISTMSPPTVALGWQGHAGGHYPQYMDESPMTATGSATHDWSSPQEKQMFSPYHSQYSSPVDDPNAVQWSYPGLQQPPAAYGSGVPTQSQQYHGDPEAIEMHNLGHNNDLLHEAASHGFTTNTAPTLLHPVPRLATKTSGDSITPGWEKTSTYKDRRRAGTNWIVNTGDSVAVGFQV